MSARAGNKLYSTENSAGLAEKSLKMCSVAMKNCILFTGNQRVPAHSASIPLVIYKYNIHTCILYC